MPNHALGQLDHHFLCQSWIHDEKLDVFLLNLTSSSPRATRLLKNSPWVAEFASGGDRKYAKSYHQDRGLEALEASGSPGLSNCQGLISRSKLAMPLIDVGKMFVGSILAV